MAEHLPTMCPHTCSKLSDNHEHWKNQTKSQERELIVALIHKLALQIILYGVCEALQRPPAW